MGKKNSNYYLNPDKFKFDYEDSVKKGFCTTHLLEDFKLIADNVYNIITKGNKNYDIDGEMCKMYAVEEAFFKWKKYNPERTPNIFAFFSQMIKNDIMAHYNFINKGKERNISMSMFQESDDPK